MLKNVFSYTPSNLKWWSTYAAIALAVCLLIFPSGIYFHLKAELQERSSFASSALQKKMQAIFGELNSVVGEANTSCTKEDVRHLQRATFYSSLVKDYGLFDSNYKVYCTSDGISDFYLFKSIIEQIEASPTKITVSLVRSKSLGEPTVFAFYVGDQGIGANALVSPSDLTEEIAWWLTEDFPYQLTIGRQVSSSHPDFNHLGRLAEQNIAFDDWSMKLNIVLPKKVFWQHFYRLSGWVLLTWILLTLAMRSAHFAIAQYRRSLSFCLKKAIKDNQLDVHFQPIISVTPGTTHDMEALVRWESPYHGTVSALSIVEIAERLDLMKELTWIVIRKVGAFYRQYPNALQCIRTAVNVDRHTLLQEDFVSGLKAILADFPELKQRLGIEVTETSVLSNEEMNDMVARLEAVKALGIRLSVDDFGTGYSGLDFLSRFPYDTLKLDQVFLASLNDDRYAQQILQSVIQMAKDLNMELVAEGVEREDQLQAITALGVERVQGYYFSRPLSAEKIVKWLEAQQTPMTSPVLAS